jgi:pimeloyl-ACP methyl ester carboxylesterase
VRSSRRSFLTGGDRRFSRRERRRLRHGTYGLAQNWARVDGRPVRSLSGGRTVGLPEIVMLAGMGAPGYLAPWVRLSTQWTRATVIDLPGWSRGKARSCTPTVQGVATALARWLEVRDLSHVVLLGHSVGSLAALRTALMVPERLIGLVLAGPCFPPDVRTARPLVQRFFTTIPREPADEIASIAPSFISSGGPGLSRFLGDAMDQRPEDLLPGLDLPVFVVAGEHDGLAPPPWARHLSELARNGTLAVLPGAHNACFPHAEAADAVLRTTVEGWVADDSAASSPCAAQG